MLYALENLLAAALRSALPGEVKVATGPSDEVPPQGEERVEVGASRLEVTLAGEDPLTVREAAFLFHVQRWSADGTTRDFTLPADVRGELTEVEAPAGHPMQRGQDYLVDGTTLRFYRPPAAGTDAVVATLRTGAARGFHERRPCLLRLSLRAWAADLARADELLDRALAVVLTRGADLGTLEAAHLGGGVRMRLQRAAMLLENFERGRVQAGSRQAPRSTALLRVQGELELMVAQGPAPADSRIEHIHYKGTVLPG